MTTEYARLRHAVLAILNYPGECSRLRSAVGSILYDQLTDALAAPPSPPVAPEPAQENPFPHIRRLSEIMEQPAPVGAEERVSEPWRYHADDMTGRHCDGCHEYGCSGLTNELPQAPKENHEVSKVSSGEAAGDGVTHAEVRTILHHWAGARTANVLLRYVDQQEQAEREAAGLRQALHDKDREITAYEARWDAASRDRDAERAQKEEQAKRALLLGEEVTRLSAENEVLKAANQSLVSSRNEHQDNYIYQLNRADKAEAAATDLRKCYERDVAALQAQQPAPAAPVAKEDDASLQHFGSGAGGSERPDIVARRMREGAMPPQSQGRPEAVRDVRPSSGDVPGVRGDGQPGAANEAPGAAGPVPGVAPVAKEEATAEAIPPCDMFCPHRGDAKRCHSGDGGDCWCVCHGPELGEPAPQPPATTGEPLLGPVDALRAEIVAALRRWCDLQVGPVSKVLSPIKAARAVADELERSKP